GYGVSTSGDYRNYFERDGRRYSHTLDPATGTPIEHSLAAVTVVDPSTLRADGLSTLLMVLGPERGQAFAAEHGIAALFVVHEEQEFVATSTAAFDELFGAGVEQWFGWLLFLSCCWWYSACLSESSWGVSPSRALAVVLPIWGSKRNARSVAAVVRNVMR